MSCPRCNATLVKGAFVREDYQCLLCDRQYNCPTPGCGYSWLNCMEQSMYPEPKFDPWLSLEPIDDDVVVKYNDRKNRYTTTNGYKFGVGLGTCYKCQDPAADLVFGCKYDDSDPLKVCKDCLLNMFEHLKESYINEDDEKRYWEEYRKYHELLKHRND